jgi:hypothetical protein
MIILIGAGALLAIFIILYVLDRLNIIRIFTRGRAGGVAGNAFRAMQGFTEMNAPRAQEVIQQEEEGKDKAQDKTHGKTKVKAQDQTKEKK